MAQPSELPLIDPLIEQQPQTRENTPVEAMIVKTIEIVRIIGTIIGLHFGFDSVPRYQLSAALIVFFLSGLTGLESLFFGKMSARSKKWGEGSPYQTQSAANNLSSAVAMIILLSIGASDAAVATLLLTVTIFFVLSGINHLVTVISDKMKGKDIARIHFQRFIFSVALAVFIALILKSWRPFT
ncbi:hypothetical protein ACHAXM_005774 [Skeletonema potamos]